MKEPWKTIINWAVGFAIGYFLVVGIIATFR